MVTHTAHLNRIQPGAVGAEAPWGLIGRDAKMLRIAEVVEAVAPTDTTTLITGESGTGKSMLARAIHAASARRREPLVTFACGSIPETLLESELFGHVRGSFTGAVADRPGKLGAADGGTLFLDEIHAASPALQLKLLRVLQERCYEPVGSTRTLRADARFVLACNEPLEPLVESGRFREDLYYRIHIVTIDMPPLRERPEDITRLAEHFLEHHAARVGRIFVGFDASAAEAMRRHAWPGNVRELENAIERAVVLAPRPTITADDLPERVRGASSAGAASEASAEVWVPEDWTPQPLKQALLEPERQILLAALRACDWNRQATARALEIDRTTLYKKMRLHGLDGPDVET